MSLAEWLFVGGNVALIVFVTWRLRKQQKAALAAYREVQKCKA